MGCSCTKPYSFDSSLDQNLIQLALQQRVDQAFSTLQPPLPRSCANFVVRFDDVSGRLELVEPSGHKKIGMATSEAARATAAICCGGCLQAPQSLLPRPSYFGECVLKIRPFRAHEFERGALGSFAWVQRLEPEVFLAGLTEFTVLLPVHATQHSSCQTCNVVRETI